MVWKMGPCYQFFTPLRASHPSLSSAAKTEDFNQGLDQVEFPSALQVLSFGAAFNQPFNHVTLPAALKSSMDCIDAMLPCLIMKLLFWKASLVRQTDRQTARQAGRQADRQTETHTPLLWEKSLPVISCATLLQDALVMRQGLKLGKNFNQCLDGVTFPSSLERRRVVWPFIYVYIIK